MKSKSRAKKNRVPARKDAVGIDALIAFNEFYCVSSEAGLNPGQALEYCAKFCVSPLNDEVRQCVNEVHIGSTLSDALINLANRIQSYYLGLAVRAILLSIRTGSSAVPYLRALSARLGTHPLGQDPPALPYDLIDPLESSL